MARKPIRISDVLGFAAAPQRDLTKGYQREVRSIPRGQKYQGSITRARPTAAQELAQLLTPNTRGGAELADRLTPALENIPLLGGLLSLVDARRQYNAGNAGQAAGLGILAALGAVPGAAGAKAAKEAAETAAERGIIAYHGSPHSFDRFSLRNIGTGEGNQAYGYGLYFAETEDVAKRYKTQGRAKRDPMMNVAHQTISAGQDPGEILPAIFPKASKKEINEAIERAKNPPPGSMYQVRINANPEDFIKWDEPLSAQSQKVKDVLGEGGIVAAADILSRAYRNPMHGGALLKIDTATPAQVSRSLLEKGIAGISYQDALSRGKENPTSNFVVFDDALIDILKKYGIAIPAIAGGGLLATQPQQDGGL